MEKSFRFARPFGTRRNWCSAGGGTRRNVSPNVVRSDTVLRCYFSSPDRSCSTATRHDVASWRSVRSSPSQTGWRRPRPPPPSSPPDRRRHVYTYITLYYYRLCMCVPRPCVSERNDIRRRRSDTFTPLPSTRHRPVPTASLCPPFDFPLSFVWDPCSCVCVVSTRRARDGGRDPSSASLSALSRPLPPLDRVPAVLVRHATAAATASSSNTRLAGPPPRTHRRRW